MGGGGRAEMLWGGLMGEGATRGRRVWAGEGLGGWSGYGMSTKAPTRVEHTV